MTVDLFGVDQVWYVRHSEDDVTWTPYHTVSSVNDTTVTTVCGTTYNYPDALTGFNGAIGVGDAPQCQECTLNV